MDEPENKSTASPQWGKVHFRPILKWYYEDLDSFRAADPGPFVNATEFGHYAPLTLILKRHSKILASQQVVVTYHVRFDLELGKQIDIGKGQTMLLADCFQKRDFHYLGIDPSELKLPGNEASRHSFGFHTNR